MRVDVSDFSAKKWSARARIRGREKRDVRNEAHRNIAARNEAKGLHFLQCVSGVRQLVSKSS